jgi:transglutaminase-like putative cysteine protease
MTRPARAELSAAAALAALTIAAALGLGRVFDDGSFALPVIVAALLPHAVGALARWRRWPGFVLGLVTFVVVLLALAWVIAPGSTTFGVPGPATIDVLARRLSAGWDVFRTGHAPVPVTDGVLMLCMLLTATVATTADLLAFRSEATLAAVVPSLLLFVFASTLGTAELQTVTTIGYSIVALVFLMLQHQALLERHRSWASGRRLGATSTWINAAAFVGGIALLLGLVVAPALPGADDGPLIDYKSLGGSSRQASGDFRTLSPLVDLRAQLTDRSDIELFRVDAPARLYWRIAALDRFDGQVWGIESRARDVGEALGRRRPPGTVRQRYTITALTDRWLPAAFEPAATDLPDARIVPESRTLVAADDITGLQYRVDSRIPAPPTEAEIAGTVASVPDGLRDLLVLPADFPRSVVSLARQITADATTPYDRAVALQAYFTDGSFTYDLNGPGGSGSGSDAIIDFLDSKRGFCEQFAAAYAAMARAVGLPARVAVGFTAGEYDASAEEFSVRARDAHAWPEVYLSGLGWTQFEPTPAGDAPGQADGNLGEPAAEGPTTPTTPATNATGTTAPTRAPAAPGVPRGEANIQTDATGTSSGGGSDDHWAVLVAFVVLGVLAALGWALLRVSRKVRRRTRRRRATVPAHSVAGAWQDALERLRDAGLPPSESLTPHEQAEHYAARGAPDATAEPLSDLADVYGRAGWSRHEPTDEDVERAWADADAVRDALAEGASGREKVRRALKV